MTNKNSQFYYDYCVLFDCIISSLIDNRDFNIAFLIQDKNHILYASQTYKTMLAKIPQLSVKIKDIIMKRTLGKIKLQEYLINSYNIPGNKYLSGAFFFVIQGIPDKQYSFGLANYYHDIQEPLRSISNFLQLLQKQPHIVNNEESSKYLSYAMNSIKKLKGWTSDVLCSFARNQQINENNQKIQLPEIIEEIQILLAFQIAKRHCSINIDSKIPSIVSDRASIISIFKNLIENSLNHANTNNANLDINIYQSQNKNSNGYTMIIFEDNGNSTSTFDDSERYGLGMDLIKKTTQSINGEIHNISKNNGYNKFEIALPNGITNYPLGAA